MLQPTIDAECDIFANIKREKVEFRLLWGVKAIIRTALSLQTQYSYLRMNASTTREATFIGGHCR